MDFRSSKVLNLWQPKEFLGTESTCGKLGKEQVSYSKCVCCRQGPNEHSGRASNSSAKGQGGSNKNNLFPNNFCGPVWPPDRQLKAKIISD